MPLNIAEGWSPFLYSIFRSYKQHGSLILYKSFDQKWFVETLPVRLSSQFRCVPHKYCENKQEVPSPILLVHAVVLRRQLAQKKNLCYMHGLWLQGFVVYFRSQDIIITANVQVNKITYLVNVFFVLTLFDLVWILRMFMVHLKQPKSNCLFLTPSRTRMKEDKCCLI